MECALADRLDLIGRVFVAHAFGHDDLSRLSRRAGHSRSLFDGVEAIDQAFERDVVDPSGIVYFVVEAVPDDGYAVDAPIVRPALGLGRRLAIDEHVVIDDVRPDGGHACRDVYAFDHVDLRECAVLDRGHGVGDDHVFTAEGHIVAAVQRIVDDQQSVLIQIEAIKENIQSQALHVGHRHVFEHGATIERSFFEGGDAVQVCGR